MFILIDKPQGITSHDVINRLRHITGIKRIGHAGTLDPNATGLLIIGIGRESTRDLGNLLKNTPKEYLAEIILGETRTTDDREGEILKVFTHKKVPLHQIIDVLRSFIGKQSQIPPIYSSIKIKGKTAYKYARSGQRVILEPRTITIHSIKLVDYAYPKLIIKVKVSSGTYIRSLARDLGERLGSGAYLNGLRRTLIGEYSIDKAVPVDKLDKENWHEFTFS